MNKSRRSPRGTRLEEPLFNQRSDPQQGRRRPPRVKICGQHKEEDIHSILPLLEMIDDVGFIFTPVSTRCVAPNQVVKWFRDYPELRPKAVAVFLDQPLTEVKQILEQTGIAHAQLHGKESPAYCRELREQVTLCDAHGKKVHADQRLTIWKVIPIDEQKTLPMEPYLPYVDGILLDTKVKGQSGGTGTRFDWSLIPSIQAELSELGEWPEQEKQANPPHPSSGRRPSHPVIPLIIAGGINPTNVQELVNTYNVQGIDVSSGVEINGQKDQEQIAALLKGVGKDA